MTPYQIAQIIWSACAFLTIVFVLLHSPKGDGLGGIGGQSQMFTSTKSAENALNRITWALGVAFISLTIILAKFG
ncbi:MAG: preprotein translocase subunit SecG [Cyanobacteria bacterium P01_G01_bin.39]